MFILNYEKCIFQYDVCLVFWSFLDKIIDLLVIGRFDDCVTTYTRSPDMHALTNNLCPNVLCFYLIMYEVIDFKVDYLA